MGLLDLSDKARVLHAALNFSSFTVDELAEFSAVKRETVQSTISRAKDVIESVGKVDPDGPGGRAIRYQLRQQAREQLAREVVQLTEQLRGARPAVGNDTVAEGTLARAKAAVQAVEASLALAENPEGSGGDAKYWKRRATEQIALGTRLVALVSQKDEQRGLQSRLKELRTADGRQPTPKPPNLLQEWQRFVQQMTQGSKGHAHVHIKHALVPQPQWDRVHLAPAALFDATDDTVLTASVTDQLRAAKRPFLQVDLGELLEGLSDSPRRVAFLHALEGSSNDVALIVTLDSSDAGSRRRVEEFLVHLKDCMWVKNTAEPRMRPEITLLDKAMHAKFVHANQIVRNLSYVNQIRSADRAAMTRVMAAVVRNRDEDAAKFL